MTVYIVFEGRNVYNVYSSKELAKKICNHFRDKLGQYDVIFREFIVEEKEKKI